MSFLRGVLAQANDPSVAGLVQPYSGHHISLPPRPNPIVTPIQMAYKPGAPTPSGAVEAVTFEAADLWRWCVYRQAHGGAVRMRWHAHVEHKL